MSDPSFWVMHGTLVWQSIVGASLGAGVLAAWKVAPRAMRARAARVREEAGAPTHEPLAKDAGKHATLIGTLVVLGEETSKRAAVTIVPRGLEASEDATPKAKSAIARGAKLALDVGGQRVSLDGAIQILVGTEETEGCIGKAAGQPLLWDFAGDLGALPSAFAVRTLAGGDRVIAHGVLRHDPPADGNYRDSAGTFALTPLENDDAPSRLLHLVAASAPRPLGRTRGKMALRALVGPLAALGVLTAVGETTVRLSKPLAWSVAATTPFRRAEALEKLRGAIRLSSHTDPPTIDRAIALDKLRGRCLDAVDDAFDHHRVLESIRLALECKDPAREARGHFARFELDAAAPKYERAREQTPALSYTLSEATTYLATGRWRQAADALRGLDRQAEGERSVHARLTCGALWAEAAGGDAEAVEKLETKDGSGPCRLLWLDALRTPKKDAYTGYYYGEGSLTDYGGTANVIGYERHDAELRGEAAATCWYGPSAIVFDPRQCLFAIPTGLASSVATGLAASATPRELHRAALMHEQLAHLDAFIGELGDARARLALEQDFLERAAAVKLEPEQEPEGYYWNPTYTDRVAQRAAKSRLQTLEELRWVLDVREGRKAEAPAGLREWDHEITAIALHAKTTGDDDALVRLSQRDARDLNRKLWQFALNDDGAGLVARLEERNLDGRGVVDFLGARPAMRPELDRWVRWNYPTECATCGVYPLLNAIASRRDAAMVAGATDVADDLGAIARRARTLLLRRDIAVVLAVISEIAPP